MLNELISEIESKFSKVTDLGVTANGETCTYSHIKSQSGIGCAIGCLLSPKDAESLQETCDAISIFGISHLLSLPNLHELDSIRHYNEADLILVQNIHDNAGTLARFLEQLALAKRVDEDGFTFV